MKVLLAMVLFALAANPAIAEEDWISPREPRMSSPVILALIAQPRFAGGGPAG